MRVIALAGTKGGVGKTTLATALAVRAAKESKRAAMVDLDPQRSLAGWYERRGDGNCENPQLFRGADTLPEAAEALERDGWDWLIADTPPAGLKNLMHNLAAADAIIIPVKASAYDLEAVWPVVDICRRLDKPHICILNDVDPRSSLAKSAAALLHDLEIPVADIQIAHRTAYAASATVGKSAVEVERDGKAAAEIEALWVLCKEMLGIKKGGRRG